MAAKNGGEGPTGLLHNPSPTTRTQRRGSLFPTRNSSKYENCT